MSVYKRKSGRYAVLVDLEPTALGGRRRKSIGTFRTRKEAEVAERKALDARDRGIDLDPKRVTLAEVAERYFKAVGPNLAPASLARDEEHSRMHVAPAFGGIPIASLKPAHIAELYARLRTEPIIYRQRSRAKTTKGEERERVGKPLGPLTVLRIHRFMHRLLGWAERMNLVARNVTRAVEPPRITPSPARALTAEQAHRMLEASSGTRLQPFFVIAATTGMRRGEVGALTWDAIDFDRGVAMVRQAVGEDRHGKTFIKATKTGRERIVPLAPRTVAALRRQRAMQHQDRLAAGGLVADGGHYVESGLVFTDELGGMLDLDAVTKTFSTLAAKAGIKAKGISLHSLRHFAATEAIVAGNDVRTVAALLGHSSARTTLEVYGHVVAGAQERAVASIEQAITTAQARLAGPQK